MWTRDREHFSRLVDECGGSVYSAVNLVAKKARIKAKETDYMILDCEAISWALTGEQPKEIHKRPSEAYPITGYGITDLEDMLSCVDDVKVAQAVRDSYDLSVKANHLIYSYKEVPDEDRQARIRVLTNLIWNNYIQDKE